MRRYDALPHPAIVSAAARSSLNSPGMPFPLRPFVGRERERSLLDAGIDEARSGRGRLFLIAGEPGIGKTRLAEEAAASAQRQGFVALWGRCWEHGGAPPFWPWIQILRAARDGAAGAARETDDALARLLPEFDRRAGVATDIADPQDRFPLFDGLATCLRQVARRQPLLLVIDDLHAADVPSLSFLEFLSHELRHASLCLVGTYRDVELQRDPERRAIVGRAARAGAVLPLAGLDADAVAHLIEQGTETPSPAFVEAVLRSTEGNPFFIDEIVRWRRAHTSPSPAHFTADSHLDLPQSVREVIGERLALLPAACRRTLAVGAVLGRGFDFGHLRRSADIADIDLRRHLEQAGESGILAVIDRAGTRFSFLHALFRDALYDALPADERMVLHRRVAEAIEVLDAADLAPHLAELAHHYRHAEAGVAGKAIDYAARAGDYAASQQAYEEAALRYREALAALEASGTAGDAQLCPLLLALGAVQQAIADDAARRTFERAAHLARALRRTGQASADAWLARAALGYADRGIGAPQRHRDDDVVALVEEALAALGPGDAPLRARLLVRLAMEVSLDEDPSAGIALSQQAVAMARRLGDHFTLAATLSGRQYVLWRVDDVRERLSIANEVLQLAERAGDAALALQGRSWRLVDLMGMGEVRAFDAEIDAYDRAADHLRQPRYQWLAANLRAMRALWAGDWAEAERRAVAAVGLSERLGDETVASSPWVQLFFADRERGDLAKHEGMVRAGQARFTDSPVPHTLLAILCLDLGRLDEARVLFETLAAQDFEDLRRQRRIGVLPFLVELCWALEDRRRGTRLEALLQPYASSFVPYGAAANFAAGAHYLGLLAELRGDIDTARRQLETALALEDRTAALPWSAHTRYHLARLGRGASDAEQRRAAVFAGEARRTAEALGMTALLAKLDALSPQRSQRLDTHPLAWDTHPSPQTEDTHPRDYVFRLDGDYWTVGTTNDVVRLKDILGMRYLAHLLRHPERELLASELAALESSPEVEVATLPFETRWADEALQVQAGVAGGGAGDALLDRSAKAAYRRRLEALRHELDEATRFNDRDRATRARAEIDFLLQELTRALGLGGRDRPAAAAERARLNVTRAIKAAVQRIKRISPEVGCYLETTIKTGTYCRYTPDRRLPVRWQS